MNKEKSLLQQELDGDITEDQLNPKQLNDLRWQRFGLGLKLMLRGVFTTIFWVVTVVIGLLALIVMGRTPPTSGLGSGSGMPH